jgi:hypothetical protein
VVELVPGVGVCGEERRGEGMREDEGAVVAAVAVDGEGGGEGDGEGEGEVGAARRRRSSRRRRHRPQLRPHLPRFRHCLLPSPTAT